MTTLPFPPRRAHLLLFWIIAVSASWSLAAAATALSVGWQAAAWTVPGLAVFFLLGLRFSAITLTLYRIWNAAVRRLSKLISLWILTVCYCVLFTSLGMAGTRIPLRRPEKGGSLWTPYRKGGIGGSATGDLIRFEEPSNHGLGRRLVASAKDAGEPWVYALFPFLVLLSLLRHSEQGETRPENIYTLF